MILTKKEMLTPRICVRLAVGDLLMTGICRKAITNE
jgi:hypothetical protein